MSDQPVPERIGIQWSTKARSGLRAIDRESAMQILNCVDRYLANGSGDLKGLQLPRTGYRLRCGDYRLFFDYIEGNRIEITSVRHRKDAYR
jgi:mRNA-degrading endonuclease RelE of RelBE toxin-antitoxin system